MAENMFLYMVGQFSELERKSIEPMALNVKEGRIRSMQRFISNSIWRENEIYAKYRSMVSNDLGDDDAVLVFDESAFPKKGNHSVGVAPQYCGTTGKIENCQVGVFAGYTSHQGYSLVDSRLFIPEKWFSDEYAEKRIKCEMPSELEFKTKPELALEMFLEITHDGQLPLRYVVADSIYGNSADFRQAIDDVAGYIYFVEVSERTTCWLDTPITQRKTYKYGGKIRRKEVVVDPGESPLSFRTIAENLGRYHWYLRNVSEGTKGPIVYEFASMQVTLAQDGPSGKKTWLIMKRTIGANPTYHFYLSNAPTQTKLRLFVWLSGIRWSIEQCFEETKTEIGMDHYEVRKFTGWYHHILLCMLSHFFLWHLKIKLGKKSTRYYSVTA
jgi:SRSO17 transposase